MDQSEYSYLQCPAQAAAIQHEQLYIRKTEKDKQYRKIFGGDVQYDQFEIQHIKLLEEEIQKKGIKLPENWTQTDTLKIIYNGKFKIKDCIERLIAHITWRANPNMHNLNKQMQEFLEAGFLYTFGRDYQFRPIIYLEAYRIDQKKYPKDFMIQTLSFFLGFVKKHMMMPGKVENWICVIDTKDIGVFGLPSGLGDIIKTMALNFVGCLHKMYVLNPSTGVDLSWKAGAAFMDDESKSKNVFLTKKTLEKLKEAIPQDQLEKKYLGNVDNLTQFWPPQVAKK
ncbi:unnamed protein product [Paramecium sonneborni]|uniref:CRAL-TRIO domain-containing protein n=1 Tax=Paramecium sonneborni TaxID=65129 RepID=A0A8S1MWH4_9CILI|nr:unnamed protein product [Paramecium sonneborni]